MKLPKGITSGATIRQPPKQFFPSSSSLSFFSTCFAFFKVSLLVLWGDTWTLQWLHSSSNSCRMAHQYVPLPDVFFFFFVSPSTVSRAWKRFYETDSYSRRGGPGCRRPLTHQQDLFLLVYARTNRISLIVSCHLYQQPALIIWALSSITWNYVWKKQ